MNTHLIEPLKRPACLHDILKAHLKESLTPPTCLHEIFEAQADRCPLQTALICGQTHLTYHDLEKQANQLARYLRTLGVGPGKLVGLYFERSERPILAALACLKAGAGYVPIDPYFPQDRKRHITSDANLALLLSEQDLLPQATSFFKGQTIALDASSQKIAKHSAARLSLQESGVSPRDLTYVIYTSGTTGRPKGVMTEHQNVVHFINAFNEVIQLTADDRVYQGFSLGFDGSVEEMWMAFSNGATLVVGTQEAVRFSSEAAKIINQHQVTVFSTVPTFLAMIKEELKSVRLLIVSGEQCPPELVNLWAKPGRRMLNVYGPTETTVNTTAAECTKDALITIGKPLRGYPIYLLDAHMQPVPDGEIGELFIGGRGLSRGYLNQSELTQEKFVELILDPAKGPERLYRTGDRVQVNSAGDLLFLGRMDSQVKIRGYRIELAEIEAVLREHPQIRAAAVGVFEREGLKELAAYVVASQEDDSLDRNSVLDLLRSRLPAYMVPGFLDQLEELPTLASGKVDRGRLPDPIAPLVRTDRRVVPPRSSTERMIASVWERLFNVAPISIEDDFFLDLGGYSLLAAQLVTQLRNSLHKEVAIRDIYSYPTIAKLAQHLDAETEKQKMKAPSRKKTTVKPSSREVFESVPRLTRLGVYGLQALSIFFFFCLGALSFAFFGCMALRLILHGDPSALWALLAFGLGIYPTLLGVSIVAKWAIVGRYQPGEYPLWGFYYFRFWLASRFQAMSGVGLFAGTPLMSLYYRLMGAKVGRRSTIDTSLCAIYDLVTIGDDTSISSETQLLGYRIEDGLLKIGRVDIGSRCFIGIHANLGLNTRIQNDASLDDLSLLPDNAVIQAGESHGGSPCKLSQVRLPQLPENPSYKPRPIRYGLYHFLLSDVLGLFMLLVSMPSLLALIFGYFSGSILWFLASIFASVPIFYLSFCFLSAAFKKLLLPRAKPGVYSLYSGFYLRKWLVDSLVRISCSAVRPLYTTIYLPSWLRLLGAKIGRRAEISTVSQLSPELTVIEDESFFADGSIVGGRHFYLGYVEVAESRIGRRSFIGNSAILPIGSALGDQCLIGCLSTPPKDIAKTPDGTEWLGSPSFQLPHRKRVGGFDLSTTYTPTPKLYLLRFVIDALRMLLPGLIVSSTGITAILAFYYLYLTVSLATLLLILPWLAIGLTACAALSVVLIKKILISRFEPAIKPLWSVYVWLNEVINGAYESVAAPAIAPLLGTPFIAPYLRLLGCKIGRHTFLGTTLFSEFDLVEIGDYAALNAGAVIQNHLFEDRVFKSSYLKIGAECSVGNMSVVLYDTEMKERSMIGPLSLLMKGETIEADSRFYGIPTVQMKSDMLSEPNTQPEKKFGVAGKVIALQELN